MFRTTPHATTGRSPAEIFLKRRPKTRFDLLKPDLSKVIQESQETQKKYHDSANTTLREFSVGDRVRVKNFRGGILKYVGGVVAKRLGPLNYLVKVGPKCRYIHIDHILKSGETEFFNAETPGITANDILNPYSDLSASPLPAAPPATTSPMEPTSAGVSNPCNATPASPMDPMSADESHSIAPNTPCKRGTITGSTPKRAETSRYPSRIRRRPKRLIEQE